ncbi:MAG TPA: ATP-binding protein [Usitatibacter sp.]|jgi:signal transduction histidine kinase|nr:ATP-binding protein [Usitatibacter sp.]
MVRLFLKLYGLLIGTLAFSFLVQIQLMDYVWGEMSHGYDFRTRFQPTFLLLERSLAAYPQAEWRDRFGELSRGFALPGARLDSEEDRAAFASLTDEQRAALHGGGMVWADREGGGFRLSRKLAGSPYVATLVFDGPDNRRLRLVTYLVNWSVEFLIVAMLLFFWVRPFWRDLVQLRAAADAVGSGDFEPSLAVRRGSPLRPLAEALETMAGRIAALLQSHRTLTSAISHELRTPLARLRFSHSLAREELDAGAKDRYLARMERDIAEMDELTSELLDYARLERGAPPLDLQTVPAGPWLEDVLADARERPGLEGEARLDAEVIVEELRCEPRYMGRAVANLVRNALQHARGQVRVRVAAERARTVIEVEDDGCGVAPADRERLFEPFVRLDRSRDRASGGFGMGLAIVRQVARWHGGDASIAESTLGGARVTIAW